MAKNLLIYITPEKGFISDKLDSEIDILAKIQVDNSLALGWKKEDIVLVTNFDYEYRGIKSLVVDDENYCPFSRTAGKINAIITLFEMGIIKDELWWFHDWDAFELEKIEFDLDDSKIAITDYGITTINEGRNSRWSTGIIYFKKGSKEVFEWIRGAVYKYKANEEVSLLALTRHNRHNILDRIEKINITYNFATRKRNVGEGYKIADKPLKVIHFHPRDKRPVYQGYDNMAVCVYGKNPMNKVLVSQRLVEIFDRHGVL